MRKIWEFIKVRRFSLIVWGITIAVSVFIGELVVRMVDVATPEKNEVVHDTVFLQPAKTDSLLQDISTQIKEFNSKIPAKRSMGWKPVKKNDTIKVEATIHLDKNEISVGD